MSDIENSVEVKPSSKKQITDAQRKARLENLRKGRETRAANLIKKKTKQETKANGHTYEILESDTDTDNSSSSDEEELVLSRKSKTKKSIKNPYIEQIVGKGQSNDKSNEIEELKIMVKQLTKERLKKKSGNKKTIINVQTPSVTPAKSNNADFYKSKLLEL